MSLRHLLCALLSFTTCGAIGLMEVRIQSAKALNATVCVYPFCHAGKNPVNVSIPAGNTTTLEYKTISGDWLGFVNLTIDILKDDRVSSVYWAGEAISGENWNQMITEPVDVSYRFMCRKDHYGKDCLAYCKASNHPVTGYFTCNNEGKRICLPGWRGDRCDEAVCGHSCGNGTCIAPDTCQCNPGWKGEKCNECDPGKKCKHGMCHNGIPGTCTCFAEYSGPNCDIDRHFCSRYSPCKNGGTCLNGKRSLGRGSPMERIRRAIEYTCVCPNGWTGKQCERSTVNHICGESAQPCLNGGRCVDASNGTRCECAAGFSGNYCQTDNKGIIRSPAMPMPITCKINVCLNGAKCTEQNGVSACQCPACFTGPRCEVKVCPDAAMEPTTVVPAQQSIESNYVAKLIGYISLVVSVGACFMVIIYTCFLTHIRQLRTAVRQNEYNEGIARRPNSSGSGNNATYKICFDGSVLTDAPPPYTPRKDDMLTEKQDSCIRDQKIYSKCDRTSDAKDPTAV